MNPLEQYLTEQSSDVKALLTLSTVALAVAIPASLIWQSFALSIIFSILNVVLWTWRQDAIPSRDVACSLVGLLLLFKLGASTPNRSQHQVALTTTRLMSVATPVLMLFEVFFLLATPWLVLVLSSTRLGDDDARTVENLAYVLAPHLFIFQSQIALESMIKERRGMVFWYTAIANSYRGAFGTVIWISRYLERRDAFSAGPARLALLFDILSTLAVILWCASTVFIAFIWYPCLSSKTLSKSEKKL
jgi:hypothetical protein